MNWGAESEGDSEAQLLCTMNTFVKLESLDSEKKVSSVCSDKKREKGIKKVIQAKDNGLGFANCGRNDGLR